MTKPASAWVEQLKAAPEAEQVICDTCPSVATCPPVGIPEGWDGVWSQKTGHVFTCPGCLDRIEAEYRAGGGVPGSSAQTRRPIVSSDDLRVLDRICACAEHRVFIVKPRNRRLRGALTRLRYRGFIAFDSWRPSESARLSWRERYRDAAAPAASAEAVVEVPASVSEPAGEVPNAAEALLRRPSSWSEDRERRFIEALQLTGSVPDALAVVGLAKSSATSAYRHKSRCAAFSQAWDAALKASPLGRTRTAKAKSARSAACKTRRLAAEPAPPVSAPPVPAPPPPARVTERQFLTGGVGARSGVFEAFHLGDEDAPRAPVRRKSDAEIAADSLRYREEQARMEAMRPPMGSDEAKLILQRRGFSVCRASTVGGEPGLWAVGTLRLTEAQMIEKAARCAR